jgi:hypothetical protein
VYKIEGVIAYFAPVPPLSCSKTCLVGFTVTALTSQKSKPNQMVLFIEIAFVESVIFIVYF